MCWFSKKMGSTLQGWSRREEIWWAEEIKVWGDHGLYLVQSLHEREAVYFSTSAGSL